MIKSITVVGPGGSSTVLKFKEMMVNTDIGGYLITAERLELYIRGDRGIKPKE